MPDAPENPTSFEELITLAATKAKGKRPNYANDPMVDHLTAMVAALAAELSVARERSDTLERLLEAKGVLNRDDIETYIPDQNTGRERQQQTLAFVTRMLRSLIQETQAMQTKEKSAEEMVERLKS